MSDENNVVPIRYTGPTAEDVLKAFDLQRDKLEAVYIVAVNKDGNIDVWGSGQLEYVCTAALILNDYATAAVRNGIA